MAYIYCIKHNELCLYVGSTIDIKRRFRQHKNMLKSNKHTCHSLQQYVLEHNLTPDDLQFVLLTECDNKSKNIFEKEYFIRFKPTCFEKGWDEFGNCITSEYYSNKISDANKFGPNSDIRKQRISNKAKENWQTETYRNNVTSAVQKAKRRLEARKQASIKQSDIWNKRRLLEKNR